MLLHSQIEKQMFKLRPQYCLCVTTKHGRVPNKSAQDGQATFVPCVYLLMPQGEHLLHGHDPCASEAFVVLAHFDGLQPLRHRPEHGAITAAGTGQADGHTVRNKVCLNYSFSRSFLCTHCM